MKNKKFVRFSRLPQSNVEVMFKKLINKSSDFKTTQVKVIFFIYNRQPTL